MADPKVKVDAVVDDTQAVQQLGKTLRNLQQAAEALSKSMTTAATAGAKYDAALSRAALSNEKLAAAAAKTALANQRVATETERTAAAQARATAATARATATTMRAETAQLRAATAHQKAEVAAQRQADAQKKLEQQTSAVKQGVDAFANTLRNVTMVAGVLGTTVKQAFDWAKEGAQITQTTIAFDHFATSIAGAPQLLDNLREASRGTISDFDLMRNTLTLVAGTTQEVGAGLAQNAPQLLEIARAAQILNPALGDVNYFYQSLATGLKRLEPRWIDNLGLIVRARDAYAAYARELGISTQALTAEQKSQAFLNEVLRVGNLLIEQNAGAVTSAVDPYSRLEVEVQGLTNTFKQWLSEGLLPYVQLINGEFVGTGQAVEQLNQGTRLSLEELAQAYEETARRISLVPLVGTAFIDTDKEKSDLRSLSQEIALVSGSFQEFASIIEGVSTADIDRYLSINPESLVELQRYYAGVIIGSQQHKAAVEANNEAQEESIELTEEQAEALEKAREAWADTARAIIANTGDLNAFADGLLAAADSADLTSGQIFRMVGALGLLSDSELQAAKNAQEFQQIQARLMAEFARTNDVQAFVQGITAAARRLGIDYQTAAQKAAQSTQLLTQAANFGLGGIVRFGQGLGNAAIEALKLKKANDAAAQSARNLSVVSAGAASAFINALEGGATGGGGGSALDAAAEKQKEWNAAFAQSFMQLLDAEEPIENWNTELLKSAAAAGASAETLALLAAATGEYSDEQIRTALHGAAMKNAIEDIAEALADGRATTDQALAAVSGFQDQLAQGGDFKFDIEAFGIAPLQEAAAAAGSGAGSAAEQTTNWTTELLKLAEQGNLTADDLVILAGATGDYTDAQIQAALKTLFMTQKLEELSKQIGKRPIQDIIADLRQFESDLDKQFELQFSTGDAEEAIGRIHRGLEDIPRDIEVKIHVDADDLPWWAQGAGGSPPPNSGDDGGVGGHYGQQHGGGLPGYAHAQHGRGLPGATMVGEVRPEIVVGGQVIPRVPPGFFAEQSGFAEAVAMAMSGSMVAPPSYSNTTNINRSNTTNNNQRSVVINNATGASASQSTRREIGAF